MFRFLCKNLVQNGTRDSTNKINSWLCFSLQIQTQSLKTKSESSNQQSLVVSYLVNSCGLSLESALSASKKLHFETTERPDSVLELFKTHGFTKIHITNLISKRPVLVNANPDILKPKLEYFESLGISGHDLAKIILTDQSLFHTSLADVIIPNVNFLRTFVDTNEDLIVTFKRSGGIVRCNSQLIKSNISTLQSHGVPKSSIKKLIMAQPITLTQKPDRFSWGVGMVKKMGFVPDTRVFVIAVHTLLAFSSLNWEKKMEVYKTVGWTEDEILAAFRLKPNFMCTSKEKIWKMMDFFVKKLGLKPSCLSRYPNLFTFGLEKRIIPRISVIQVLKSKGLVKKDQGVLKSLCMSIAKFEKTYVNKYKETDPDVIEAYQCKITLPESNIRLEDASRNVEL